MTTMDTRSVPAREAPRTYSLDQIKKAIDAGPLIASIAEGFRLYSEGKTVVPLVGYLPLESPPGDVYIKYSYITGDDVFVIKVASGFSENPALGLPVSSGIMLVFSQNRGLAEALLLDEGYLTGVRTGIAGAVAADHLAPSHVEAIGVVGAGTQGRFQLRYLKHVTDCRKAVVWGRGDMSPRPHYLSPPATTPSGSTCRAGSSSETKTKTSHAIGVSHPEETAKTIIEAARSLKTAEA